MTHSKMLNTRRIRQSRMKELAKIAKRAKKQGKQAVKKGARKAPARKSG